MPSLDRNLRRDLENAVNSARRVAEAGARQAVEQLAVGHHEPWSALTPDQRKLRNRLRAHGRQLGDKLDEMSGTQCVDRLTGECAYEHWHRLLFARFLAENDLLIEPDSGMALSLDECRELAREQSKDWLELASDFAQRMLPQIFRAGDPVLEVALPPEKRQELESILEGLPREIFIAEDSLGWVYQFWQAEQKNAVNASEKKIGADELPAVTQLFTEDYMVLFLLHNTLGAWWAGKVLAQRPELALSATSEDELRTACAAQGIKWSYLRFVREGDAWRPAAGTFPGWPTSAKDLKVLDPCMGSGHFLAFALPVLVALRREEEKLSVAEAVDAVLRDNLFGLELDPRCTQIAAFNVGLTAWTIAGNRPLPPLNLACAGLSINAPVAAWTALAEGDTLAENAMKQLYELFRQAPTLGSLIDPTRVGDEMFVANFDKIRGLLSSALASEESENAELAVIAQGIAKAASIMTERYTLVATNVPYLGRGLQCERLQREGDSTYAKGKADLCTMFLERCHRLTLVGGTIAAVTPQNWWFLAGYEDFRRQLLREDAIQCAVALGEEAWQTFGNRGPRTVLLIYSNACPSASSWFWAIDAASGYGSPVVEYSQKPRMLAEQCLLRLNQEQQLHNPSARILLGELASGLPLSRYVDSAEGLSTGDNPRFARSWWEVNDTHRWVRYAGADEASRMWGGRTQVVDWSGGTGPLARSAQARIQGTDLWGRDGVLVGRIRGVRVSRYSGDAFDKACVALSPRDPADLPALIAFISSPEFEQSVRTLDQKVAASTGAVTAVPFDIERWRLIASQDFSGGLPPPHSDDPTQWLFAGEPKDSTDPLQVAMARLVGYSWPRQISSSFVDCPTVGPDLSSHADDDGIVCLPSLRGEAPASERVRALLADAFGEEWTAHKLNELLTNVDFAGKSLDDWLRDGFFEQHCNLFQQRPFIWQIWDGRKDGFSALVNYHQLTAPNAEGRRALDKLTHTYLGDWLDRQRADQRAGVEGADGRVAAAEHLKRELEKILEGEPPYDIFVRWKPLHEQAVGWQPDINDGVRINIRPFITAKPLNARGKNACILRVAPKIKWDKDRGKESTRERADFPWFWGWEEGAQDFAGGNEFDGNRWNDLHYTRAAKLAARERTMGGTS